MCIHFGRNNSVTVLNKIRRNTTKTIKLVKLAARYSEVLRTKKHQRF